MSNALYNKGKEGFLDGSINWISDTIKVVLIDNSLYTVNLATHDYFNDVSAAVVGTPQTLVSKTVTNGVADGADITFSNVNGATIEALIIYKDTGVASTSRLIAYIDTASGLPITPNSGDIIISWNNGSSKIFSL